MTPEAVINEVKKAGLRGRGGGGFHTAVKWEGVRNARLSQNMLLPMAMKETPAPTWTEASWKAFR